MATYLQTKLSFEASVFIIAVCGLFLLALSGLYRSTINLSISNHFYKIGTSVLVGYLLVFVQFFGVTTLFSFSNVWSTFVQLITVNTLVLFLPHLVVIGVMGVLLKKGYWRYRALLIGSASTLNEAYKEIQSLGQHSGLAIADVLSVKGHPSNGLSNVPVISNYSDIDQYITSRKPDELIIALPSSDHQMVVTLLSIAKVKDIRVRIVPDLEAIMMGQVRIDKLRGMSFVTVSNRSLPVWQKFVKRCIDIVLSVIGLMLMAPIMPFIIYRIKKTSSGPVFYSQERIGKGGKPFQIIKFRTMTTDAEAGGPALSSANDQRITEFGRVLRRYRLDETPQFWNVLMGHMSIVGPRPERRFYIDQLTQRAPHFSHLLHVRPGITSLGMVKYGYAENLDEMEQRLAFDILYMENLSLWLDFKIIVFTIKTLLGAEGK